MRYLIFLLLSGFMVLLALSPLEASPEDVCLSIMKGDVRDTQNIYSEEETFNRYKSVLKSANFRSYQEMASQGGSLGLNIPIAKAMIGLSADAESDSGTFQKEMNEFLNSTYSEAKSRRVNASNTSRINTELIRVLDNCQANFFGSLRDRVRLITLVEPSDYETFVVRLDAYIPDETEQDFIIRQIEPAGRVTCTENGEPARLGLPRRGKSALLTCTKDKNRAVRLVVRTNAGTSNAIPLPAVPPPQPRQEQPTVAAIVWTAGSQPPSQGVQCSCLRSSPTNEEMENMDEIPTVTLRNECRDSVAVDAFKFGPAIGSRSASFVVQRNQSAVVDLTDISGGQSGGGGISVRNCPGP